MLFYNSHHHLSPELWGLLFYPADLVFNLQKKQSHCVVLIPAVLQQVWGRDPRSFGSVLCFSITQLLWVLSPQTREPASNTYRQLAGVLLGFIDSIDQVESVSVLKMLSLLVHKYKNISLYLPHLWFLSSEFIVFHIENFSSLLVSCSVMSDSLWPHVWLFETHGL